MSVEQAYNSWAEIYDSNDNTTRDLEMVAKRKILDKIPFRSCLELGCGTGKNTEWLMTRCTRLIAVDLSAEMLKQARKKIIADYVEFHQADLNEDWNFVEEPVDLITFSLVLEHIEDLEPIFQKAAHVLKPGGKLYLGELHPFKQYAGSKARFETGEGTRVVPCFDHHLSDFLQAAQNSGLTLMDLQEHFDAPDRSGLPRILTLLFRKE